jgi:hypothetical protein
MSNPYLSIVIAGRNDNYGGDFRQRLDNCINWTYSQLTAHKISAELIFVNYNPLPTPAIKDFIHWPQSNGFVKIRILTISADIHKNVVALYGVKDVPVLEYIAKNAGIRRAKGDFILSMNPDILIDERLFENFANLSPQYYYRCNRFDFSGEVDLKPRIKLFDELKSKINQIWFKGNYVKVKGVSVLSYYYHWLMRTIDNKWKNNTERIQFFLNPFRINVYTHNVEFWYHCNAAGDFMLTSRENWNKLKGYKENSFISLHTDSLFVIQAATSGIKERIFKCPVFHKEHERRYDALKENEEQRKIYLNYQQASKTMVKNRNADVYNGDDWGLGKIDISEIDL